MWPDGRHWRQPKAAAAALVRGARLKAVLLCAGVLGADIGVGGQRVRLYAAIRAWGVKDDLDRRVGILLGIEFAVDGGEGAEKLIGDVGEDGGATGRDLVFGEEKKEAGEEAVRALI